MTRFKLNEAIDYARRIHGKKILKKELARQLFPNSTEKSQAVLMTKLARGGYKGIEPAWVEIVCKECGVTPNQLFGAEEM